MDAPLHIIDEKTGGIFSRQSDNSYAEKIPHGPWFIAAKPTEDGQAIIENGTQEGCHIAVCEWHVAEFIVETVNKRIAVRGGKR